MPSTPHVRGESAESWRWTTSRNQEQETLLNEDALEMLTVSPIKMQDHSSKALESDIPSTNSTDVSSTSWRNVTSSQRNPLGALARIPAKFALYLQLQLRYRFGVTIALPRSQLSSKSLTFLSRRIPRNLILLTCALPIILILLLLSAILYGGLPPSYAVVRAAEHALPQHRWNDKGWKGIKAKGSRISGQPVRGWALHGDAEESEGVDKYSGGPASDARYLRFPDHLWGHGLNNVLQEAIMTGYLTLSVNRTPVFEDYIWSHLPLPYTLYDFTLRPTRMPLGAFVGGVLTGQVGVGDVVNNGENEKWAISAAYFEHVCPPSDVDEIIYHRHQSGEGETKTSTEELVGEGFIQKARLTANDHGNEGKGDHLENFMPEARKPEAPFPEHFPSLMADGKEIIDWFKARLDSPDMKSKRCIVIREERKIFDPDFFGTERILPILPDLLASPLLKKFAWSSLVQDVVDRNIRRFFTPPINYIESHQAGTNGSGILPIDANGNTALILPGVVAVHLRRGDYKRHCIRLRDWGTTYLGVVSMLSDRFDVDKDTPILNDSEFTQFSELKLTTERNARKNAFYMAHCLPSIQQVVQRLRQVRQEHTERNVGSPELRDVYVLTNGWPIFMDELRVALVADGWRRVIGTPDWDGAVPRGPLPGQRYSDAVGGGNSKEEAELTSEERGVSAAIDMGIGEMAEVFVGNGFSTLSANVIMLRLAKGLPIWSNRVL